MHEQIDRKRLKGSDLRFCLASQEIFKPSIKQSGLWEDVTMNLDERNNLIDNVISNSESSDERKIVGNFQNYLLR